MKTPNLSEQQVADLSPVARDAYFQQKAEEGVDPDAGWLFGAVQQFIASGKAQQQSQEVGDKNVQQLTQNGDVKYVEGLEPSNADYQGYDHDRLKQFVNSNLNVEQVSDISTAYHEIHRTFGRFATTLAKAINDSMGTGTGTWDGDAADDAQKYFTSLSAWADGNSQNAKLASEMIYDQGTAASTVKNTMPEPIPFSWKQEVGSWVTSNPFNLGENIDKSIQKQKDSQEAHTQAASAMHTYDNALYEAASKQPVFAEPPKFGQPGEVGMPSQPYPVPPGSNPPGSNPPPGSGTYIPPGGGSSGSGFRSPGSGNLPGPGSSTGSGSIPSSTTPSGFQNGPGPVNTPSPNTNMGPMPMSPMPMSPMMTPGMGDSDYNGRSGRGGGSGSGFGPGSGAGSTPGSGAASGAARPGGVGAAEAAAGRGMGGLGGGAGAGRGGMGMGGGMGGRGQSAEGDEDTEHQRPTYLVEGDPDEVFGTDMRTAPPVIGE